MIGVAILDPNIDTGSAYDFVTIVFALVIAILFAVYLSKALNQANVDIVDGHNAYVDSFVESR